jgi:hypothetical protein
MGALKEEHHEYFDAPMSVVMGLWGEQKPKRKQKIEIFMNKKPILISSLLEENKVNTIDGVIFNLDTGGIYGGGINVDKNRLAE